MTHHVQTPVGVPIIGVVITTTAGVLGVVGLGAVVSGFGSDGSGRFIWPILGVLAAYAALIGIRVGLGVLRTPPTGRKRAEMTVWAGIPMAWVSMGSILATLADGATNVALLLIAAGSATFWSAIVASGALYLRSPRVRAAFDP